MESNDNGITEAETSAAIKSAHQARANEKQKLIENAVTDLLARIDHEEGVIRKARSSIKRSQERIDLISKADTETINRIIEANGNPTFY